MKKTLKNNLVKPIPYMEDGQIKNLDLENGIVYVHRYIDKNNTKMNRFRYNYISYTKTLNEYYETLNKYLEKNKDVMMNCPYEEYETRNLKLKICMYIVFLFIDLILIMLPLVALTLTNSLLAIVFISFLSLIGICDLCFVSVEELKKYIKIAKDYKGYLYYRELEKQNNYNHKFVKKSTVDRCETLPLKDKTTSKFKTKKRVKAYIGREV